MKTRVFAVLLALCLLLSCLVACTPEDADDPVGEHLPGVPAGLIMLTDQIGRTVTLEAPAKRVVSCYYVSSYAMMALGLSDRLVGIENKAASRPIYAMSAPGLLELPAVGTMKECNVELIASLEPDLVILPKKLADSAAAPLQELGLKVVIVNPESHEQLWEMLTIIAKACGVDAKATELINYYKTKNTVLGTLTADVEKPTVYFAGNSSYLTVAPAKMYQSSLIETAGGINVAADLEGDYWTEVSYEAILKMNPDVIILPSGADYTALDMRNDPQLSDLDAVIQGEIYTMPGGIEEWDSPIPSGILGTMWLTWILHPTLYTRSTFLGEAIAFYENFYGFTPDAALLKG